MQIIKKTDLSVDELEHIREMINYNNMINHSNLDISIDNSFNYSKDIITNFLAYKSDKLVGYANVFAPSNEAFEVQSMVLKDYERIRINTKLIESIKSEASIYKPKEILLVCDESSESGMSYIEKVRASYRHSEYFMKLIKDYVPSFEAYEENLTVKKAKLKDLEDYIEASKRIYDSSITNLRERFSVLFEKDDRKFYILYENNIAVGIGSIIIENEKHMLYGFGISSEKRGKGYSKYFLNKIIETTMKEASDSIYLEVDSTNNIAYNLYKHNGFNELKKISYFRLEYK
ncbi:MAG: GNAT family N-acetyltransferase [Acidaminobacteraceae bacterium]